MRYNGIFAAALGLLAAGTIITPSEAAKRPRHQAQSAPPVVCGHSGCSDWAGASPSLQAASQPGRRGVSRASPVIGRAAICARVQHTALVASINAQLRRWVKPTGLCGAGETEELMTFYWSGRRTANGEPFHPGGMTAAHLTLPFGTNLRVRNPRSGAAITVRINDRGPCTDASIDLARGAAARLGYRQSAYVCVSRAGAPASYADAR